MRGGGGVAAVSGFQVTGFDFMGFVKNPWDFYGF